MAKKTVTSVTSAPLPDGTPVTPSESMNGKGLSNSSKLTLAAAAVGAVLALSSCDNSGDTPMSLGEQFIAKEAFADERARYDAEEAELNRLKTIQNNMQALIDGGTLSQDSIRIIEKDMAMRQITINALNEDLQGKKGNYLEEATEFAGKKKKVPVSNEVKRNPLPEVP